MKPFFGKFAAAMAQNIESKNLPGETGAARAQQIGVLFVIYFLRHREENSDEPVTNSRIAEYLGTDNKFVWKITKTLSERGLIEGTKVHVPGRPSRVIDWWIVENDEMRELLERAKAFDGDERPTND